MSKADQKTPFPSIGRILDFVRDCFSLTRAEAGLTQKQAQRLASGVGMSHEKIEESARVLLNAIYKHVNACDDSNVESVFETWESQGGLDQYFPESEDGRVCIRQNQFLQDSLEFFWRHNDLQQFCSSIEPSKASLRVWIEHVLWPYLTSTYVDYVLTDNNPDEGMPGGDIWILPSENFEKSDPFEPIWTWPTQKVLNWWEDLLGENLINFAEQLCGAATGDTPRRSIERWTRKGSNIDFQTIERWTNQKWNYKGAFTDDTSLPLSIRWAECLEFLKKKGYASKPSSLGEQIPGVRGIRFDTFFQWANPVRDGKPVERIIDQVARRWKAPPNSTLRARLLIARAANRAWKKSLDHFGPITTRAIRGSFSYLYNRYFEISYSVGRGNIDVAFDRHMELEHNNPSPFRISAGAMLSQGCMEHLPSEITKLVEIVENIDEEAMEREFLKHFPGK